MGIPPKSKFSASEIDMLEWFGSLREEMLPKPGNPSFKVIEEFGARQIERMQSALALTGRVASKRLSQSLVFEGVEIENEGDISITWAGEDYAKFIDEGVNGIERNFGAPYSFRLVRRSSSIRPRNAFFLSIKDWIKFRNIKTLQWKDKETNKTVVKHLKTEKDFDGAAFVIMRGIKRKGIDPNYFISDAFEDGKVMEELNEEFLKIWQSQ